MSEEVRRSTRKPARLLALRVFYCSEIVPDSLAPSCWIRSLNGVFFEVSWVFHSLVPLRIPRKMPKTLLHKLSRLAIMKAKPQAKPYLLSDGGRLFLRVQPDGAKLGRWKSEFAGKNKTMATRDVARGHRERGADGAFGRARATEERRGSNARASGGALFGRLGLRVKQR